MGITYEGNYSFAYTEGGEVHTELGEGPAAGSGRGFLQLLGAASAAVQRDEAGRRGRAHGAQHACF